MRRKANRQEVIYQVALGGISAAIALLLLWLSVLVRYGTIGFYVAACCAIIVPLTQKYYFPSIAAYVVSSLLAFAIVGDFFIIAGYVVYFAPMAIATSVMTIKKVKIYIALPIKIVYINLALAFLYYVAGTIMVSSEVIANLPYWAVAIVGTAALVAIDFLMQYVFKRLTPVVGKALRKRHSAESNDAEDRENLSDSGDGKDDNPFSDDEIFGTRNTFDGDENRSDDCVDESTDGDNNASENGENNDGADDENR